MSMAMGVAAPTSLRRQAACTYELPVSGTKKELAARIEASVNAAQRQMCADAAENDDVESVDEYFINSVADGVPRAA